MASHSAIVALVVTCYVYFASVALGRSTDKPHYDLSQSKELFYEFTKAYNRTYVDYAEWKVRHQHFLENLKRINTMNSYSPTSVHDINKFADLSADEFKSTFTCYRNTGLEPNWNISDYLKVRDDLPDSFDWRDKGIVAPIKNQGMCGSCWAFSSISAVESQHALKHDSLLTLAEQQLVDCDSGDAACQGGDMLMAFQYLVRAGGVMTDEDYPYTAAKGACAFDETKVKVKVTGKNHAGRVEDDDLMALLVKTGPLSVALNADSMVTYRGGVDSPADAACDPARIDHAVTLVGFGAEGGVKYWLIRNSWGEDYGERGYYRLVRGRNACGINSDVSVPTVE